MHSPEDDGCLSRGMRRDRSTVYLSTTMGPSTNTAKPGQGRWLRLGWAAIKTAKGGKGGILLNDCLMFMWAIIGLVNFTIIKKRKSKGEACNCFIVKTLPLSKFNVQRQRHCLFKCDTSTFGLTDAVSVGQYPLSVNGAGWCHLTVVYQPGNLELFDIFIYIFFNIILWK